MKKLLLVAVVATIWIFSACQDSLVTEPTEDSAEINLLTKEGTINLCCPALDPLTGECSVNGTLSYSHKINEVSPSDYMVYITIRIKAEICGEANAVGHLRWIIQERNEHSFQIRNNNADYTFYKDGSEKYFTRRYHVGNRGDILLEIRYRVDLFDLRILQMKIVSISNVSTTVTP
jgi:hypothetical protein